MGFAEVRVREKGVQRGWSIKWAASCYLPRAARDYHAPHYNQSDHVIILSMLQYHFQISLSLLVFNILSVDSLWKQLTSSQKNQNLTILLNYIPLWSANGVAFFADVERLNFKVWNHCQVHGSFMTRELHSRLNCTWVNAKQNLEVHFVN